MNRNLSLLSVPANGAAWTAILAIALSLILGGCRAHKGAVTATPGYSGATGKSPSEIALASTPSLPDPARRLMAEADRWLGTPYRYGDATRGKGADCSGFITQVFSDALAIKLPRNSARQREWCADIKGGRAQAQPGDLIFFAPGKKGVTHVGLYIGDGKMIHSSSSKGVVITSLDEAYYARSYHSAGRVEPFYALMRRDDATIPAPAPPEPPRLPATETTATISLDRLAAASGRPQEPQKASQASKSADSAVKPVKPVTQQPDTALTPAEARRRLLLRLETDSIR